MAKCQHKVCAWCQTNVHTPRMSCSRRFPVYESPRWVNDMDLEFMGSAQGVPMELRCRRWQSMPVRDPNSPPQYAHLKPNESGNFFLPPGIPPPALRLRRILWSFQFAASPGPWWWVPDNGASTACNNVNTIQKIRTGQCIALVGSVAYNDARHWPIQVQVLPDQTKKDKVLNMENKPKSHQLDHLKFTIRTEQTHTTEYQPSLAA
jgi:hypothetical protein